MVRKTYSYGNASSVKCYADGGRVTKPKQKMAPPEKGKKPEKVKTAPPGGSQTPGAKGTYKPKKMADGGKVYGSPMDTPKPGGTDKGRPKVGDKDPNFKKKPFKPSSPVKPAPEKKEPKRGKIPSATERRLKANDVY